MFKSSKCIKFVKKKIKKAFKLEDDTMCKCWWWWWWWWWKSGTAPTSYTNIKSWHKLYPTQSLGRMHLGVFGMVHLPSTPNSPYLLWSTSSPTVQFHTRIQDDHYDMLSRCTRHLCICHQQNTICIQQKTTWKEQKKKP